MPDIDRDDELLRLDDALKLAGVVGTGGEAKVLIQSGEVRVNGVVETRRKRKLTAGDVIEVGDEVFEIAEAEEEDLDDGMADPSDVDDGPYGASDDEDDEDDPPWEDDELDEWRTWIEARVAEGDVEAVIIRMGGLDPRRLEAVFARLPKAVEAVVLDALDEVLERSDGWEGAMDDGYPGDDPNDPDLDERDDDSPNDGPIRA